MGLLFYMSFYIIDTFIELGLVIRPYFFSHVEFY